ncbi:MAG: hypothetical protein WAU45_12415 [Blastocatellia bacterium]
MRQRTVRLTATAIVAAFVALGFGSPSHAQQWDQRYWNRMSKRDVERVIANTERIANDFRRDLDRWLDNSRLDGTEREDQYNSKVKDFEQATNRLRAEFDRRDKWWETRNQVRDVLNTAKPIANFMRRPGRRRYSSVLADQWWHLRKQLNKLAITYRLPQIN